jgi:hypothetical protein
MARPLEYALIAGLIAVTAMAADSGAFAPSYEAVHYDANGNRFVDDHALTWQDCASLAMDRGGMLCEVER